MNDNRPGPHHSGRLISDQMQRGVTSDGDTRGHVLALSDERQDWQRRLLAVERRALRAEFRERSAFRRGYRAGYARQFGDSIPWDWAMAEAAVRAAEHWTEQEALRHERSYLRRAHGTPDEHRTDAQRASLGLFGQDAA